MATRIKEVHAVVLTGDEVDALASLLYSLDKENADLHLPPNYKQDLLKARKELFGQ